MKFSIGYPTQPKGSFFRAVSPHIKSIGEVYFAWDGFGSGRPPADKEENTASLLESDLNLFYEAGVRLNLLLNGSCYGENALSTEFALRALRLVESLGEKYGLSTVTTASPFLAHSLKSAFPFLDVRASVNMWIDGIEGMRQCMDIFDSFYVKREYNRRPEEIRRQAEWCHQNGKRLYLLANSGCIPNCAFHIFHDTMVSHGSEVAKKENDESFVPYACRRIMKNEENHYLLLAGNLVRPEDVHHLEGIVDGVKLATRVHPFPSIIIGAYANGSFPSDLCALTEPGFGDLLGGPYMLDNSAIPDTFWATTTSCKRNCAECGYCRDLYKKIKKKIAY